LLLGFKLVVNCPGFNIGWGCRNGDDAVYG